MVVKFSFPEFDVPKKLILIKAPPKGTQLRIFQQPTDQQTSSQRKEGGFIADSRGELLLGPVLMDPEDKFTSSRTKSMKMFQAPAKSFESHT